MDPDDDLDELRRFRADQSTPSPDASARIAAQIRARTGIDVGGSVVPFPGSDVAPPGSDAAPPETYVADPSPAPAAEPAAGSRRWFLVAAAAAAAVVVAAVLVLRPDDGTQQPTLTDLAASAAALPDRPLGPGEFQYSLVDHTGVAGDQHLRVEEWIAADDSGRSISTPLGSDGAPVDDPTDVTAGPGQLVLLPFPYSDLRDAPTTADGLRDAFVELSAGEQGPDLLGEWTAGVLAWDVTPPAVRVAALELLVDLGYEPIGEVTDPTGRNGWGYALEVDGTTYVVVLDPGTDRTTAFAATTGDPSDLRGAPISRSWRGVAVRSDTGA